MEQKQMILLVAILAIVVIVIIAAVMMGGGGQDTTTPPATSAPADVTPPTTPPATTPPATVTPPAEVTPPAGTGEVNVNDAVIAAMSAGQPVICTMTIDAEAMYGDPSMAGYDTTMTMKIKGMKGRAEIVSMGTVSTVITDGSTSYIYMPTFGDSWYMITAEDTGQEVTTMPTPQEIKDSLASVPEGMTLECQIASDIPDSEFALPAGATVKNYEDMYTDMMGDIDLSAYQ